MSEAWEWIVDSAKAFLDDAEQWSRNRMPVPRLILLAYLVYAGVRHLASPLYRSWFAGITLAFHEIGHIVFSPFGPTLYLLGGSIFQLAIPLAAALYLLIKQRDYFGLTVGCAWLSYSAWELATYVGDAREQLLPLVGFSDNPHHDWYDLLAKWRMLQWDTTLATITRIGATLTWGLSMAFAGWLCWKMFTSRSSPNASGPPLLGN